MNYERLIYDFWVLNEEVCFTPNETKVYFALLNISNRLNWKNPFNQSNEYLSVVCGITKPTLIRARNTLKQRELIDFSSEPGRRKNTTYTLKRLKIFTISDTNSDTNSDTISDTNYSEKALHNYTTTTYINNNDDVYVGLKNFTNSDTNYYQDKELKLLSKPISVEQWAMMNKISVEKVKGLIVEFVAQNERAEKKWDSDSDLIRHFESWLRKYPKEQAKIKRIL